MLKWWLITYKGLLRGYIKVKLPLKCVSNFGMWDMHAKHVKTFYFPNNLPDYHRLDYASE